MILLTLIGVSSVTMLVVCSVAWLADEVRHAK